MPKRELLHHCRVQGNSGGEEKEERKEGQRAEHRLSRAYNSLQLMQIQTLRMELNYIKTYSI